MHLVIAWREGNAGGGSAEEDHWREASAAEYRWESSTARPRGCRVGGGAAEETPDEPGPECDRGCVHSSGVAEETPDERGGLGVAVGGARGEAGHKEELDGEEPAQGALVVVVERPADGGVPIPALVVVVGRVAGGRRGAAACRASGGGRAVAAMADSAPHLLPCTPQPRALLADGSGDEQGDCDGKKQDASPLATFITRDRRLSPAHHLHGAY
jgi:hypothetical protein